MEKLTAQNGSIIVFLLHAESIQNIPEWNVSLVQEERAPRPASLFNTITPMTFLTLILLGRYKVPMEQVKENTVFLCKYMTDFIFQIHV